ncbi:MAG: hypothetical protein Q7S66_03950 [bacterium]|nr:hypothetical protein [bacterium]
MSLNNSQQLNLLIEPAKHILVVFGKEKADDDVATALAWKLYLEKNKKQVTIAADGFQPAKRLRFLPALNDIKAELSGLQKMIIKVDISKAKLETVSYDVKDNWLSIYLSPKNGIITKDDLRTAQTNFKYDLIITVGIRDLDELGEIFYRQGELFYHTPIVNIDHQSGNEHFGQLNLVDLNATSNAELSFQLLEQLGAIIDADMAGCLLTGMIARTKSFKTSNVTPNALNAASRLISLGADREKIVQHLFRGRSISSLKLWGIALTNLETDRATSLVWTAITRDDFTRAGAEASDLDGIAADLIANSPEAKLILIFNEDIAKEKQVRVSLHTEHGYDAVELLSAWQARGNKKMATAILENTTLAEAKQKVIERIEGQLKNINK